VQGLRAHATNPTLPVEKDEVRASEWWPRLEPESPSLIVLNEAGRSLANHRGQGEKLAEARWWTRSPFADRPAAS
jgi:hypothetical protein